MSDVKSISNIAVMSRAVIDLASAATDAKKNDQLGMPSLISVNNSPLKPNLRGGSNDSDTLHFSGSIRKKLIGAQGNDSRSYVQSQFSSTQSGKELLNQQSTKSLTLVYRLAKLDQKTIDKCNYIFSQADESAKTEALNMCNLLCKIKNDESADLKTVVSMAKNYLEIVCRDKLSYFSEFLHNKCEVFGNYNKIQNLKNRIAKNLPLKKGNSDYVSQCEKFITNDALPFIKEKLISFLPAGSSIEELDSFIKNLPKEGGANREGLDTLLKVYDITCNRSGDYASAVDDFNFAFTMIDLLRPIYNNEKSNKLNIAPEEHKQVALIDQIDSPLSNVQLGALDELQKQFAGSDLSGNPYVLLKESASIALANPPETTPQNQSSQTDVDEMLRSAALNKADKAIKHATVIPPTFLRTASQSGGGQSASNSVLYSSQSVIPAGAAQSAIPADRIKNDRVLLKESASIALANPPETTAQNQSSQTDVDEMLRSAAPNKADKAVKHATVIPPTVLRTASRSGGGQSASNSVLYSSQSGIPAGAAQSAIAADRIKNNRVLLKESASIALANPPETTAQNQSSQKSVAQIVRSTPHYKVDKAVKHATVVPPDSLRTASRSGNGQSNPNALINVSAASKNKKLRENAVNYVVGMTKNDLAPKDIWIKNQGKMIDLNKNIAREK